MTSNISIVCNNCASSFAVNVAAIEPVIIADWEAFVETQMLSSAFPTSLGQTLPRGSLQGNPCFLLKASSCRSGAPQPFRANHDCGRSASVLLWALHGQQVP